MRVYSFELSAQSPDPNPIKNLCKRFEVRAQVNRKSLKTYVIVILAKRAEISEFRRALISFYNTKRCIDNY